MIEQYEKEAMKDLESFYGTDLQLTDRGKAWVAGYVQAKLKGQAPTPQIDWSKAPEWANYHAFNDDGQGYWFEKQPISRSTFWSTNNRLLESPYKILSWKKSLTRRPDAE